VEVSRALAQPVAITNPKTKAAEHYVLPPSSFFSFYAVSDPDLIKLLYRSFWGVAGAP